MQGDVNFFIQKDYKDDAPELYDNTVENCIDDLRTVIRNMETKNIETAMKYTSNQQLNGTKLKQNAKKRSKTNQDLEVYC